MPLYRTGRSSIFLSTPSARRATPSGSMMAHSLPYFYPRPLRGGRRICVRAQSDTNLISIHALCEEGDNRGGHGGL